MPSRSESIDLKSLIDNCTKNPNSREWNQAWETLIDRYKIYVYSVILRQCHKQNINDYGYSPRYIADDIYSMFLVKLCKNQAKSLKSLKTRNNEKVLRAFLATIANRVAINHIKYLKLRKTRPIFEDSENELVHIDIEWEIYQHIIEILRQEAGPQEKNLERDILLFNLVTLEGFEKDSLDCQPIFRKLGHRVIDNVIHRFRQRLAKSLRE